jgi:hypothetical protein
MRFISRLTSPYLLPLFVAVTATAPAAAQFVQVSLSSNQSVTGSANGGWASAAQTVPVSVPGWDDHIWNDGWATPLFSQQCGEHRSGESYPSADGCNTCSCTARGEICSLRACAPTPPPTTGQKCLSSDQCGADEYCTTEDGDCQSACAPGAENCIQACAGVCRTRPMNSCAPIICPNGTSHPSCSADGDPINYFADPCQFPASSSSSSSSDGGMSCSSAKQQYDATVAPNKQCTTDADCTLFVASCPYVTCGEAVRKDAEGSAKAAADAYTSCQQQSGQPVACAMCAPMRAACEQGQCVAKTATTTL